MEIPGLDSAVSGVNTAEAVVNSARFTRDVAKYVAGKINVWSRQEGAGEEGDGLGKERAMKMFSNGVLGDSEEIVLGCVEDEAALVLTPSRILHTDIGFGYRRDGASQVSVMLRSISRIEATKDPEEDGDGITVEILAEGNEFSWNLHFARRDAGLQFLGGLYDQLHGLR